MTLENILTKFRKKTILALALAITAYQGYSQLNLPTHDNTPIQISQNQKPIVLVADDNSGTRGKIEKYLRQRGYEVIQAETFNQAKIQIQTNPNITKLITDMDFTGSYEDSNDRFKTVRHRTEGVRLIGWLNEQQQINQKYYNIDQVTIHSTVFNKGDEEGMLARPFAKYLKTRVKNMGDENLRYTMQPKTAILDR